MSEEEIKKIAKEEFMNNVMKQLDSTLIFTYIQNLENQLQQKENIIKEVREYINNHLYMESTEGIQHPTFDGKMNSDADGFEILEILDKVD